MSLLKKSLSCQMCVARSNGGKDHTAQWRQSNDIDASIGGRLNELYAAVYQICKCHRHLPLVDEQRKRQATGFRHFFYGHHYACFWKSSLSDRIPPFSSDASNPAPYGTVCISITIDSDCSWSPAAAQDGFPLMRPTYIIHWRTKSIKWTRSGTPSMIGHRLRASQMTLSVHH